MKEVYPFLPKKYESLPGVHKTAYHNVELATYLKKKKGGLIGKISVMNIGLQRAFLRAFFDDEGSVYFIGKRRAVRGYQHSVQILKLIHVLLKKFGIESKVDEKYNEITITRRENIAQFSKEINFSKGVTVNGKRSNSVWKQSLEKRHILRQALASYA
ncbi:MAG: LAGLIDADG family homing endonuclease [bacterium]|nr:LAGLIDADG family homing endonuclease [bacterium]